VERHIREEMLRPELRRKFRLRPCITALLEGVSGSGKTLTVNAIYRRMYEIMAEVTGTPMEELPHQVFKFKPSKALSMWLGESDKNCDRFFDEVEQRAGKPFVNPKGKSFLLPVLVVMEEIDGMGRARGEEAIYDRIMTTILQRLDPNREGLGDKLVVFLSTTNEPHIVDHAMLRRIGGTVESFGRLDQKGFVDVLKKHVKGLPMDENAVSDVHRALFNEGVDPGVVELAVGGKPIIKHRRDFVTGALIDRAVQDAATQAWEMAAGGEKDSVVTSEHLLGSLDRQVLSVVGQLTPNNVSHYLDLPEGAPVTAVRKLTSKQ
jgi:SpoVK/Ycf46/Vps4 family AAA+-type ATPase